MKDIICTLYEGNYHLGLAGLVNSLVKSGFKGVIYAGCKVNEALPNWSKVTSKDLYDEMEVTSEVLLRFYKLETDYHFTNYKPHFMLRIMEITPSEENFFYFDPDIVIVQPWKLFSDWVNYGVALCQDINYRMPSNHIAKLRWIDFAQKNGFTKYNSIDGFCNGGFVGLKRNNKVFLENWERLMDISINEGLTKIKASWNEKSNHSNLFSRTEDQDLLNLTMIVSNCPLSIAGPDAMGFAYGRRFMFHSLGQPKAWNISWKHIFSVKKISESNIKFFNYIKYPINISHIRSFKIKLGIMINKFKR